MTWCVRSSRPARPGRLREPTSSRASRPWRSPTGGSCWGKRPEGLQRRKSPLSSRCPPGRPRYHPCPLGRAARRSRALSGSRPTAPEGYGDPAGVKRGLRARRRGEAALRAKGLSHNMIDETLIKSLGVADDEALALLESAFGRGMADGDMDSLLAESMQDLTTGNILDAKVIGFAGDDVVVDLGLKSEGLIPKDEFSDLSAVRPGDTVKVLLESLEGEGGLVQI